MEKLALGVDIGGTNTAFGLVDGSGNVSYENSIPTAQFKSAELLVEAIYTDLESKGLTQSIQGIGIGAPNGNFFTGSIEFAPNLPWKGVVELSKIFKTQFGVEAVTTNDANAAAIGEMTYGEARDLKDFVMITLGTGLGSGVVVNGKLVYGHDGFAGEYGHFRVIPNGRLCGCGRKGCLETYASSTGIVRSIQELDSENKASSSINSISNPTAVDIFNSAAEGDKFCQEIIDYTTEILGGALADFASITSPKAYILFGGIAQSGQKFASSVKTHMEDQILNIFKDKIEVRISGLHDKNAAVLGASSLVWNELILI